MRASTSTTGRSAARFARGARQVFAAAAADLSDCRVAADHRHDALVAVTERPAGNRRPLLMHVSTRRPSATVGISEPIRVTSSKCRRVCPRYPPAARSDGAGTQGSPNVGCRFPAMQERARPTDRSRGARVPPVPPCRTTSTTRCRACPTSSSGTPRSDCLPRPSTQGLEPVGRLVRTHLTYFLSRRFRSAHTRSRRRRSSAASVSCTICSSSVPTVVLSSAAAVIVSSSVSEMPDAVKRAHALIQGRRHLPSRSYNHGT